MAEKHAYRHAGRQLRDSEHTLTYPIGVPLSPEDGIGTTRIRSAIGVQVFFGVDVEGMGHGVEEWGVEGEGGEEGFGVVCVAGTVWGVGGGGIAGAVFEGDFEAGVDILGSAKGGGGLEEDEEVWKGEGVEGVDDAGL